MLLDSNIVIYAAQPKYAALRSGLILATNNEIDFKAVPGLRIHNPLKQ